MVFPNRVARRLFPGTLPISLDGPSRSRATHPLDASIVRHTRPGSSRHKRTSYAALSTTAASADCASGRGTINKLPDSVLLHIFDLVRLNDYPHP
jgi:hypothetical protein